MMRNENHPNPVKSVNWWQRLSGRATLNALQDRIAQQEKDIDQLQKFSKDLQKSLQQSQQECKETLDKLRDQARLSAEYFQEKEQLYLIVKEQKNEIAIYEDKEQEYTNIQKEFTSIRENLEEKVQQTNHKLQEIDLLNQELWKDNDEKQQHVNELKKELTALQKELQDKEATAHTSLQDLRQALADRATLHQQEVGALQHSLQALQATLAEQQTSHGEREQQAQASILDLQQELHHLQQQLTQAQERYHEAIANQQAAEHAAAQERTELAEVQAYLLETDNTLLEQTEHVRIVTQQLEGVQEDNRQLQQRYDTQTEEITRLQLQFTELQRTHATLQQLCDAQEERLGQVLQQDGHIEELTAQLEALQEAQQGLQQHCEGLTHALEQLQDVQQQYDTMCAQHADLERAQHQAQTYIQQLEAERATRHGEHQEVLARFTEAKAQYQQLLFQYNALAARGEATDLQTTPEAGGNALSHSPTQYRTGFVSLQAASTHALMQAVGEAQALVLLRAAWLRQDEDCLKAFLAAEELEQVLTACGTWLAQLALCTNFTVEYANETWICSWQPDPSFYQPQHTQAQSATTATVALLWAVVNARTAQHWHCRILQEHETCSTRAVFSHPS